MHIFVIPSWVAGAADPTAGIFALEQAQAIARLHPDWIVTFSAVNCHYLSWRLFNTRKLLSALGRAWTGHAGEAPAATPANFLHRPCHALAGLKTLRDGTVAPLLAAHRRRLVLAAKRENPVILHAHVAWPAGAVAQALSREFGIPYIVTEHMGPFPLPDPPLADASGRATRAVLDPLEHADAVVAVSDHLAAEMRRNGVQRPIRIIANLVDCAAFHPVDPQPTDREFTFLTVSRLTEGKGISDLLQAVQAFIHAGGRARYRIVGPGPRTHFERIAEGLGIKHAMSFLGPMGRDDVAAEMRAAHALIMPTRHESFGVTAIEAMASGIPVLATRSGGPDSIITTETGLLVPPADPAALALGMAEMIARHGDFERPTLVALCRARYGADAVGTQIADLYREVLAGRAVYSG